MSTIGSLIDPDRRFVVFEGPRCIAHGTLAEVTVAARKALTVSSSSPLLAFDRNTGAVVDIDYRQLPSPPPPHPDQAPKRGRPKLGVVPREVTLLPRHWDWLSSQPGGASAALRRLVDEARQERAAEDRRRMQRDATYRFMAAMAGDLPGFEEMSRMLFSGDYEGMAVCSADWPVDVRDEVLRLLAWERPL